MLKERLQRTIALIGEENFSKINNSSVMVIGCGAVGGYALEMVARLGFQKIYAVDFDVFEQSNINRQILATTQTIGLKKCEVAKERILAINPEADVLAIDMKLTPDNLDFLLHNRPDFVIDAIDDVKAKAELIKFLVAHNFKFVSAMGAALKTKPELLKVANLNQTSSCHLAKKLREMLRNTDCDLKKVRCVYSLEPVKIVKDKDGNNILGSLPMVPSVMGTMLATEVFNMCLNKD